MSNWNTKYGKDALLKELKQIEETFLVGNLRWDKIKRQQEDALAVTVDIIKRQVRNGLVQLKPGLSKDDLLYQQTKTT